MSKKARKKTARAKGSAKKSSGAQSAKPAAKKKAAGQESTDSNTKPAKPAQVKITAAKGRPMLSWIGKRPLSHVTPFPAQLVERHDALRILGIPLQTDDIRQEEDRIQLLHDL